MNYWLIKSEGSSYSIDDLRRDKKTSWGGVRNYQARNFMKAMKVSDLILFYHSSSNPTGVYGVAKVFSSVHPDETQFDKNDEHFEPKATKAKPMWFCVDVSFVEKFKNPVSLDAIKFNPALDGMLVRARGSRLSIQPVSQKHFELVRKMAQPGTF